MNRFEDMTNAELDQLASDDYFDRIIEDKARQKANGHDKQYSAHVAQAAEWPVMDDAAYYGLAGDVVRTIEPHSEADPVAILIQFLAAFGNAVGNGPHYQVESDKHHANLYVALTGDTAIARKGTSWGRVSAVMRSADEVWADNRAKGGLSSGEGLINEVRDPRMEWNKKEQCEEVADQGVRDKRLLVIEPEFAGVLAVAERHGNTLSPVIRKAWDGGKLSTLTKNTPLTATGAHISIVGHITVDELCTRLTRTDIANGFANRFLYPLVRRSKELPFGGELSDSEILYLGERTRQALDIDRNIGRVTWAESAANEWRRIYSPLSASKPGLLGAATARGGDRPGRTACAAICTPRRRGEHLTRPPQSGTCGVGLLRGVRRPHLRRNDRRPARRRDFASPPAGRPQRHDADGDSRHVFETSVIRPNWRCAQLAASARQGSGRA